MLKLKIIALAAILTITALLAGCSNDSDQASIVATSYPVEFVARAIAQDHMDVINITPVGVEPHDFELSPSTTNDVLEAQLVIVLGGGFQPAIEKTVESRSGATLNIMESLEDDEHALGIAAQTIRMSHGDEDHGEKGEHEDDGDNHDEHHHDGDAHIWLDPIEMKHVAEVVADAIIDIDPDNRNSYTQARDEFIAELDSLHESYEAALSDCELSEFVTSHDAFSRLAQRYELTQISLTGFSPHAEPTPAHLTKVKELIAEHGITTIFTEEISSPKVAQTLSQQLDITLDVLSPIESLTSEQQEASKDYFSLMKLNRDRLSSALKCSAS